MSVKNLSPRTLQDWLALPEGHRVELIDGDFVEKASPGFEHGDAQAEVVTVLRQSYQRGGGGGAPGGWWIVSEVDVLLDGSIYRPDVAGWRRERCPEPPRDRPVGLRPDWICEVVSPSNAAQDTVRKMRRYHQAGVPHYWLVFPHDRSLAVYRHGPDGYVLVLAAESGETVRAEPFDAVELVLARMFGGE